jgi:hypothetical protein
MDDIAIVLSVTNIDDNWRHRQRCNATYDKLSALNNLGPSPSRPRTLNYIVILVARQANPDSRRERKTLPELNF